MRLSSSQRKAFFILHILDPLLPEQAEILLVGDALVAALALVGGPRESKLLKFMHEQLVDSDVYQKREHRLSGAQEYGVGNPVFDHGSRGRVSEMRELMQLLGLTPRFLPVPPICVEYLDSAARYWLVLNSTEPAEQAAAPRPPRQRGPRRGVAVPKRALRDRSRL